MRRHINSIFVLFMVVALIPETARSQDSGAGASEATDPTVPRTPAVTRRRGDADGRSGADGRRRTDSRRRTHGGRITDSASANMLSRSIESPSRCSAAAADVAASA